MIQPSDLVTIALLIALEGLLSADNAMVLAVMVLGLPKATRRRRCTTGWSARSRSGRGDAAGGLPDRARLGEAARRPSTCCISRMPHFSSGESGEERHTPPKAKAWFGLSAFWATVVRVELVEHRFRIDSILVAVAMSPKLWVVLTGGILGIVTMRLVIGQLLALVETLSGAGRRRVRHHRVGGDQAAGRSTCTRRATSASRSRSGCRSA